MDSAIGSTSARKPFLQKGGGPQRSVAFAADGVGSSRGRFPKKRRGAAGTDAFTAADVRKEHEPLSARFADEMEVSETPTMTEDGESYLAVEEREHPEEADEREDSEDDGDDVYDDDIAALRREIANTRMQDVMTLRERVGPKLFDKLYLCESPTPTPQASSSKPKVFKRENSKRPREMSSKKPVSKFRNIFPNASTKVQRFDPRFDERCGQFDEFHHRNNYKFVDELRQDEKKKMKAEMQNLAKLDPEKAAKMKKTMRIITDQERALANLDRRKEVIREVRKENNQRLREGKMPIYETKASIRKRVMKKKFDELRKTGGLEKYMAKKAKKQGKQG